MGIYMIEDPNEAIFDMMHKARTAHETIKHNEESIVAYYDAGFRDMKYQDKHMEEVVSPAAARVTVAAIKICSPRERSQPSERLSLFLTTRYGMTIRRIRGIMRRSR